MQKNTLPTRLLDVGRTDKIKLVITSREELTDTKYVALSYCWGPDPDANFTTDATTMEDRLAGFPISRMPLTLQDSVQVARSQGLRYLWIDALCIIQKDAEDWVSESARMDQVYGNAYFTIVASSSRNVEGGLFKAGPHGERPPCTLLHDAELFEMPKGETDPALFNKSGRLDSSEPRFPLDEEAIFSRAWALQEWLLSPRLLVFTGAGVFFVCEKYRIRARHDSYQFRLTRRPEDWSGQWQRLVIGFCSRNLKNPDDKLPALSGLARQIASLMSCPPGDYVAGLWRAHLARELCWFRDDEGFSMNLFKPNSVGRRSGRAPSWSWASIDGNVVFPENGSTAVTIHSCQTEPTNVDSPFGKIKGGILVLSCPYMKVRLHPADHLKHRAKKYYECVYYSSKGKVTAPYWDDDPSETQGLSEERTELYCAVIYMWEHGTVETTWKHEMAGIVLVPQKEQNTFTRTGYFRGHRVHEDGEHKMTFTIT